ncbi:hypothetical protein SLS53_006783 [Cytospora paraplurivora]|uniref:Adenosine deaminase domain-containing protein n=1 Tax=Cytospora paraplurivora TaxID=2898453 RepID=A0AAN9YDR6_9PEZI
MDWVRLPKIELHAHLSGSISRQCLHEVWLMKKEAGETDLADPLIEMPDGKHDYDLKVSPVALTSFFPLFSSYIYHLVNDLQALRHTTLSVLQDFARDGVVYLELRTTPRALPKSNLSKAGYIAAILGVIREFESSQDAAAAALHTRLIISVDRRNTLPEAQEAVDLAVAFGDRGVVGVDLCGDPTRGGIEALQPAFERARAATHPGLGVTLHFAEAEASGSDEELFMLLGAWRPDRIGHVIHVSERVKREIVGYPGGLGLELCLSCNTDDVGVFGSPLSNEYRLVAEHFNLSESDIRTLARKGIDVIFGGAEEKQRLRAIMDAA